MPSLADMHPEPPTETPTVVAIHVAKGRRLPTRSVPSVEAEAGAGPRRRPLPRQQAPARDDPVAARPRGGRRRPRAPGRPGPDAPQRDDLRRRDPDEAGRPHHDRRRRARGRAHRRTLPAARRQPRPRCGAGPARPGRDGVPAADVRDDQRRRRGRPRRTSALRLPRHLPETEGDAGAPASGSCHVAGSHRGRGCRRPRRRTRICARCSSRAAVRDGGGRRQPDNAPRRASRGPAATRRASRVRAMSGARQRPVPRVPRSSTRPS